jgi:hypothetical protein
MDTLNNASGACVLIGHLTFVSQVMGGMQKYFLARSC